MAGDSDEEVLQLRVWGGLEGAWAEFLYLGWTTRLSGAINARYGAIHLCKGARGGEQEGNKW